MPVGADAADYRRRRGGATTAPISLAGNPP